MAVSIWTTRPPPLSHSAEPGCPDVMNHSFSMVAVELSLGHPKMLMARAFVAAKNLVPDAPDKS